MKKFLNGDTVFGSVTLTIGLLFYISAMSFSGVTSDGDVHEGFFPKIIAMAVIVMSIVLIYQGVRTKKVYFALPEEQKENFAVFVKMVSMVIVYILAWPFIPFILQTTLLMFGLGIVLKQTKKFSIIFALVFSVGLYGLFVYGFNILL